MFVYKKKRLTSWVLAGSRKTEAGLRLPQCKEKGGGGRQREAYYSPSINQSPHGFIVLIDYLLMDNRSARYYVCLSTVVRFIYRTMEVNRYIKNNKPRTPGTLNKVNCTLDHLNSACLKEGSTLKCRNALGFDFTALLHLCFSVALYMHI